MQGLGGPHRRGVDDAGTLAVPDNLARLHRSILVIRRLHHRQQQVRAIDTRADDVEIDVKPAADVADHLFVRGGRQSEHGRRAERAYRAADLQIGRPKVVAPLRYAMRLVDHDEFDGLVLQFSDEIGIRKALGRREDELGATVLQRRLGRGLLFRVLRAIERDRTDACVVQLVDLVLHQGDQRRDDQRSPRQSTAPATGSTWTCRRPSAGSPACCGPQARWRLPAPAPRASGRDRRRFAASCSAARARHASVLTFRSRAAER